MSRVELSLRTLVDIAEAFCSQRPRRKGRGRPPNYSEGLVLALWTFKQLNNLSFRELEAIARKTLENVPDFSTLHYRVRNIPHERWEEFNHWLVQHVL